MSYNSFVGPLPSNNITWPHKLRYLDLSSNGFTGSVPSALFSLPSLVYFSLGNNNLTGYVGEFQSPMLQKIELSTNSLKGANFTYLSKLVNVEELDLSSNNLDGTFELDVFSSLQKLQYVDLSDNSVLSPRSRNNTTYSPLPNLRFLCMSNCNANEIPFFIRNLIAMDTLYLSQNNIQGLLPEWLPNTSITTFDLNTNSITGGIQNLPLGCGADLSFNKIRSLPSNVSGMAGIVLSHNLIESGLENVHQMAVGGVDLSFNKLHGPLPDNMSMMTMSVLDLSHNFLESGVENLQQNIVASIDLSFNELAGTLPSNISVTWLSLFHNYLESGLENLPWIQAAHLDLSCNKFVGEIKGNISINGLNLSHNYLTGVENIRGSGMEYLDLSFNSIRGPLPIPSGNNMISVYLVSNNKLSNIPQSICDLGNLWLINLSYNNLSGKIPDCMLEIPTLAVVNLRRNNLSGIIPQSINGSLKELDMSNNQLHGIIPRSLANCQELEILDLSSNLIYDRFPSWLDGMQFLKVLLLRSNRLYGDIPSESSTINISTSFTQLRVIDLSNNMLYGNLPSHYFKSWKSMMKDNEGETYFFEENKQEYYIHSLRIINKGMEMEFTTQMKLVTAIDFSNNKFGGVIPESIINLRYLIVLNLSGNHLSGDIPSSLGKLVQLNSLDLSRNKFSGRIPGTLSSLTFLSALNLSENNLQGQIPQGGQLTTFPNDSFTGNTDLCGIPLSTKCGDQHLPNSPPGYEYMEEERNELSLVDGFTWESVAIGYGCGLVLGIFGGVVILKRYQEFVLGIFNIKLQRQMKRTHQR